MQKILIVDDDRSYLKIANFILKSKLINCFISTAENGPMAISKIANETFNLILCDYEMPLMNGYDVITNIRKNNKNIKIIANSSSEKSNEALTFAGANDSFIKNELTSKTELLVSKIQNLLARV